MNPIKSVVHRVEQFLQENQSESVEMLLDELRQLEVDEHNEEQVKRQIANAQSHIQQAIMAFPSIHGHLEPIQFLEELQMDLMETHQDLQGRESEDNSVFGMLE